MNYQVHKIKIGKELELFIPDPEKIKSTYDDLIKQDPSTPFPYWAKNWASSIALLSFLNNNPNYIHNKNVLELGAGIGLPSLGIAYKAKSIIISDHNNDAIELIGKNIEHLGLTNATGVNIDWNEFPENVIFDVVLLSDINYVPSEFDALWKLFTKLLTDHKTLILATPQRITSGDFLQPLTQFITHTSIEEIVEDNKITLVNIIVLQMPI
jgi:predicted nicotinamide N-methyase